MEIAAAYRRGFFGQAMKISEEDCGGCSHHGERRGIARGQAEGSPVPNEFLAFGDRQALRIEVVDDAQPVENAVLSGGRGLSRVVQPTSTWERGE